MREGRGAWKVGKVPLSKPELRNEWGLWCENFPDGGRKGKFLPSGLIPKNRFGEANSFEIAFSSKQSECLN